MVEKKKKRDWGDKIQPAVKGLDLMGIQLQGL